MREGNSSGEGSSPAQRRAIKRKTTEAPPDVRILVLREDRETIGQNRLRFLMIGDFDSGGNDAHP